MKNKKNIIIKILIMFKSTQMDTKIKIELTKQVNERLDKELEIGLKKDYLTLLEALNQPFL